MAFTGAFISGASWVELFSQSGFGGSTGGPQNATAAFNVGLWAAYSQTVRPPRQNPMMPSREVSPPCDFAHATVLSRSDSNSASGFEFTIDSSCEVSVILVRSVPLRK